MAIPFKITRDKVSLYFYSSIVIGHPLTVLWINRTYFSREDKERCQVH